MVSQIPSSALVPFVYVEVGPNTSQPGAAVQEYRSLVIGQKLSSTPVAQNVPTLATSADQVGLAMGFGSMVHAMALRHFQNNPSTETWFVGVDDAGGGVKATKTLTVTGPATATGSIFLYIAGRRIVATVVSGDAQNAIAAAINAAIAASEFASQLPVTATVATNVVTLLARNAGTQGNAIDARLNFQAGETTPTGVAVAVAAGVSGATDPTLTAALAALGPKQFHVIAVGLNDATSIGAVDVELAARFGPVQQLDGSAVYAKADTHGNLITFGGTLNSKHTSVLAFKSPLSPPWEIAAAAAAEVALSGQADPGLPMKTLPLTGIVGPASSDRFTLQERELLLKAGLATAVTDDLGVTRLERVVTTYKTNEQGALDASFRDITSLLILSYFRFSFRTLFGTTYGRHKLARNGTRFGAGQAVVTPEIAEGFALTVARGWEERGLLEDFESFKANLVVRINALDPNRLEFLLPVNLINQLQVTGASIAFSL